MSERDVIVGDEEPFVPFSEADVALGKDHRALSVRVDGKDATREMHLTLCAMMWNFAQTDPSFAGGEPHDQFMREFIAGANHDLRALGLPMVSVSEVRQYADHPSIRAATDPARPRVLPPEDQEPE